MPVQTMNTKNYKYPQEWINVGDVNPERHGGIFVKWDGIMWQIIETRHFADLPDGVSQSEHMFMHGGFEPMDIWIDGNPYNGFTEWAEKELNSFSSKPFNYVDPDLLEHERYDQFVDYYLENEIEWLISSLAFAHISYYGGQRTEFEKDYWDYLSHYGIDKENF